MELILRINGVIVRHNVRDWDDLIEFCETIFENKDSFTSLKVVNDYKVTGCHLEDTMDKYWNPTIEAGVHVVVLDNELEEARLVPLNNLLNFKKYNPTDYLILDAVSISKNEYSVLMAKYEKEHCM